jgi:hypothetical protein
MDLAVFDLSKWVKAWLMAVIRKAELSLAKSAAKTKCHIFCVWFHYLLY